MANEFAQFKNTKKIDGSDEKTGFGSFSGTKSITGDQPPEKKPKDQPSLSPLTIEDILFIEDIIPKLNDKNKIEELLVQGGDISKFMKRRYKIKDWDDFDQLTRINMLKEKLPKELKLGIFKSTDPTERIREMVSNPEKFKDPKLLETTTPEEEWFIHNFFKNEFIKEREKYIPINREPNINIEKPENIIKKLFDKIPFQKKFDDDYRSRELSPIGGAYPPSKTLGDTDIAKKIGGIYGPLVAGGTGVVETASLGLANKDERWTKLYEEMKKDHPNWQLVGDIIGMFLSGAGEAKVVGAVAKQLSYLPNVARLVEKIPEVGKFLSKFANENKMQSLSPIISKTTERIVKPIVGEASKLVENVVTPAAQFVGTKILPPAISSGIYGEMEGGNGEAGTVIGAASGAAIPLAKKIAPIIPFLATGVKPSILKSAYEHALDAPLVEGKGISQELIMKIETKLRDLFERDILGSGSKSQAILEAHPGIPKEKVQKMFDDIFSSRDFLRLNIDEQNKFRTFAKNFNIEGMILSGKKAVEEGGTLIEAGLVPLSDLKVKMKNTIDPVVYGNSEEYKLAGGTRGLMKDLRKKIDAELKTVPEYDKLMEEVSSAQNALRPLKNTIDKDKSLAMDKIERILASRKDTFTKDKQLQAFSDLIGEDVNRNVERTAIEELLSKESINGSRNVNLWKSIFGAIPFAGEKSTEALGAITGGILDRTARPIVKGVINLAARVDDVLSKTGSRNRMLREMEGLKSMKPLTVENPAFEGINKELIASGMGPLFPEDLKYINKDISSFINNMTPPIPRKTEVAGSVLSKSVDNTFSDSIQALLDDLAKKRAETREK